VFAARREAGGDDLEAVEMAFRAALHQAGAAALTQLLRYDPPDAGRRELPCRCGDTARYRELRARRVLTAVGEVELSRPYYLCSHCGHGTFPADADLDIQDTALSPGVRRMLAVVGSHAPFDHGRQQIQWLAGLDVTTKAVERTAEAIGEDIVRAAREQMSQAMPLDLPAIAGAPVPILYVQMDGTGVPVVNAETEGRAGKIAGRPAHTREAKLGCVFTQTAWDTQGWPIRDADSTTYAGAIETAEEFGHRIYRHAWDRGWPRAVKKVVMGDGAEWIWNIADLHFPGAIQIVDLFHARQHLWDVARLLHPGEDARQTQWTRRHQPKLDGGHIEQLVRFLRSIKASTAELAAKIGTTADYFETNANRMRYPDFRRQHLFVGSGVIEAGCKTVVGSRLKQSGMFWTVRGANAILALRCCQLNNCFETYWENRRCA